MSYATLEQLKTRLKGAYDSLTDRTGGTTADDVVGAEILAGAHGILNTYLASRYAVPVNVSSDAALAESLKGYVLDIAEFKAWTQNSPREDIPERVQKAFDDTMRTLRDIAAGKALLPGASPIPGSTAMGPSAEVFGDERIFTRDSMRGF